MTEDVTALDVVKEWVSILGNVALHTAFWGGFLLITLWALVHIDKL